MADKIDKITDEKLQRYIDWFDTSLEALRDGRLRAMRDRDFYDGNQWTATQIKELDSRGQPVVTTNHIAPKINYILGEQISARVDPAAYPTTPAHEEDADAMTCAMRYVTEVNDSDQFESEAAEDFLIEGTGAMLIGQELKKNGEIEIKLTPIPWDRFAWDHRSKRRDFRDARWLAAVAWYDLDDAIAEYKNIGAPGYEEMLRDAVSRGNPDNQEVFDDWPSWWSEKDSQRVRICQMFYREDGEWYECHFTKHPLGWIVKPRLVTLTDDDDKTHCPIIAASAYVMRRRGGDAPERYGVVRGLISPQEEINKRRSKAMHYINMNQIIAERGAFLATKEEVREELANPDSYLEVTPGALRDKKIEIRSNLELAQSQFQLLQEAKAEIDNIGPQAPLIGSDDRVQTGRSLQVRGEAGEKQLRPALDAYRFWQRRLYRAIAWQIKRFWPAEKWIRVTDDKERRGYRFVAINRRMTRGDRLRELLRENVQLNQAMMMIDIPPVIADETIQQAMMIADQQVKAMAMAMEQRTGKDMPPEAMQPLMQQAILKAVYRMPIMQEKFSQNHVGDIPIDIKIDVSPESIVLQHEEFAKLAELAGSGQVPIPAEALIRASQLRNKRELLATLNPPPDPMQQQMAMLQLSMLQAQVDKVRAEAADEMASAQERQANVEFKLGAQAAKTGAQAMESAAKAGQLTIPDEEGTEGV